VKSGYVVSRSGWFSDRSACYLASGRPVIAQDTGFGRRLPTGDGLFAFSSVEEVVAAIAELTRDYETHRRAARAVAEEHLASDHILRSLLEQVCQ
jgi:glycosyltransferase involved in cell wall biosynthesis